MVRQRGALVFVRSTFNASTLRDIAEEDVDAGLHYVVIMDPASSLKTSIVTTYLEPVSGTCDVNVGRESQPRNWKSDESPHIRCTRAMDKL